MHPAGKKSRVGKNYYLHSIMLCLVFRSTAFGIHAGMGRIGAILGNVTFGHLIDADRSLPILLVAAFLGAGAVASVFLPPIYRTENRPPFQRAVVQLWKRCRRQKSKSSPDPVVSNNYGSSPSDS